MYSRFAGLWRLMSTALLLCASCLLAASPAHAGPDVGALLTGTCVDQIRNGSFEALNFIGWTTSGSPTVWSQGGHTGWHSALLGGRDNAVDEISQSLPCPYEAEHVSMTAYIYMSTQEVVAGADCLQISVSDGRGCGGTTWYCNNHTPDIWWPGGFACTGSHACEPGVTWTVLFRATTSITLTTWFFVDDVSLDVCCPDDAFEPNDSFATAHGPITGTMNVWLCPNGDEDWFQFPAADGQTIVADLTPAGAAQCDLCLYRPDGSQSACSANPSSAAPEHIQRTADQTGSWRVRVYDPSGGTSTAASQLQIQVSQPPAATSTPTATGQAQATPTRTLTPTRTATGQPPATSTRTPTRTATPPGWTGQQLFLPVVLRRLWQPRPEDCSELLTNGSFETGALPPWERWGDTALGTGRNSAYGGQLGGRDNASGELWQWVTIPADADALPWEFWWKAEAASAQPNDFLMVRLEAGGEEPTFLTLRAEPPLDVWRQGTVDLTPWAGRRVLLDFLVNTDGSVPTTFRVDDVSVRSCVSP